MSTKWSSSRIGTFNDCPLKYKLNYVEKWEPEVSLGNDELARKGSTWHETVEKYVTGETLRSVKKRLIETAKQFNISLEEYPLDKKVPKFIAFWNEYIKPKEEQGFEVKKEITVYGKVKDNTFMGIFDLEVSNDKEIHIFDYKTSKNPNPNSYKKQLLLYAYLAGQQRNWTLEQTVENVKLRLFYPLCEDSENDSVETQMKKSVFDIQFTLKDLKDVIEGYYVGSLDKISKIDWTQPVEGNISYACKWCQYLAAPANGEFCGCPITVAAGIDQPLPGVKYVKSVKN